MHENIHLKSTENGERGTNLPLFEDKSEETVNLMSQMQKTKLKFHLEYITEHMLWFCLFHLTRFTCQK